ncbi:MAG TPA: peptide-methionine (R)-S-oxide reductase MsrB [Thermoanaerobaculia bacterium]
MKSKAWIAALTLVALTACNGFATDVSLSMNDGEAAPAAQQKAANVERKGAHVTQKTGIEKIQKTDAEWKKILTPEQYHVLRQKGTERAWSGEYVDNHEKGVYVCAACGLELFRSDAKFESGTGWPSFYEPIDETHIGTETDRSFFTTRTEVHCARCGGHLGHVFPDGPRPTGLRYCMNSVSLKFKKAE